MPVLPALVGPPPALVRPAPYLESVPMRLSYDGVRYWTLAKGEPVPRPFHFRWLLPRLLGPSGRRWQAAQAVSFVGLCGLAWAYTDAWAAALVPFGLAGLFRFNLVDFPVLVDLPALALALAAAVVAPVSLPAAVGLVFVAGATKETAPIFAAGYAWNPWLLVGLAAPLARALRPAGRSDPATAYDDDRATEALTRPVRRAAEAHKDLWKDPWLLLAPWGLLLAGFAHPSAQTLVVCGLAYGQLLVATDCVRLYVWAFPVLASETFHMIPARWWVLALVVHFANPAKTGGL